MGQVIRTSIGFYRLARIGSKPLAFCDNQRRVPCSRWQSGSLGSRNQAAGGEGLWQMGLLFDAGRQHCPRKKAKARLIVLPKIGCGPMSIS